jgi:hypothetical protein
MGVGSGGYAERCRCSASSSHWCANSSYRRLLSSCQQRFASSRHSAACARNPSVLASKSRRQTGRSAMKSSVVMAISHQFHRWLAGYCDRWVRAVIAITKRHFALGGRPSSRLAGKTNVLSVGYRVPTPPCMEPSVLDADRLEARASAWNLVRISSVMFDGTCLPHGSPMPKQDDYEDNAGVLRQPSMRVDVDKAYLLALAERWLRPADQIDCVLRRWLIPAPFKASRSLGPTPLLRRSFPLNTLGK